MPNTFRSVESLLPIPALLSVLVLATRDPSDLYSIIDLGALSGGISVGNALNSSGETAGASAVLGGDDHPFLRDSNITDLGTLQGGVTGRATGINDQGEVVGSSGINQYGPQFNEIPQAFLWRDGAMQSLGALWCPCDYNHRYGQSEARAINSLGEVVGFSQTPRCASEHAFLWRDGVMQDISGGPGDPSYSEAYAINDAGQVAGLRVANRCTPSPAPARAFLWDNGVMQDLGVLPGHVSSVAYGINEAAQAVGESTDGTLTRAVRWDGATIVDLGVLSGQTSSSARDINTPGQVVGSSWGTDRSDSRATLWQDGVPHDLNDLVGGRGGWVLRDARAINDSGQIVGTGLHDGRTRGFLLTPRAMGMRTRHTGPPPSAPADGPAHARIGS